MGLIADQERSRQEAAPNYPEGLPQDARKVHDLMTSLDDDDRDIVLQWMRTPMPERFNPRSEGIGNAEIVRRLNAAGHAATAAKIKSYRLWLLDRG